MEKVAVEVLGTSKLRDYTFRFLIHHSDNSVDRRIAESFYREHSPVIPTGDHHEVEILSPDLRTYSAGVVHYHASKKMTGGNYICWTGHLPKFQHAMRLLKAWTPGAIYAMETGTNLIEILAKHGIGANNFLDLEKVMAENYGIKVQVLR